MILQRSIVHEGFARFFRASPALSRLSSNIYFPWKPFARDRLL